MKQNPLSLFLRPALAAAVLTLFGCGPQAFVPNTTNSAQTAAGTFNVPSKVDIVFSMSSNGTMTNIYPGVNTEVPGFLTNLQNSGWDYRFVSIPLSQYHPTDANDYPIAGEVSVSYYDANWPAGTWLPPYPGATYGTAPAIANYLFASLFYVYQPDASDPVDAHETGFDNQLTFLNRADVQSNFLRPDAMLAVITVSNGDDRSDWNWGAPGTTNLGSPTVPLNTYAQEFIAAKGGSSALVQYYSIVAHLTDTCRGYGDWSGQRYESMSNTLNGKHVDICSVSVADSLSAIQSNIQSTSINFVKDYLVIGNQPNPSTIVVTKFPGGNTSNPVVVPQDPANGWSYAGAVPSTGVYTVSSPVQMDEVFTGYLIQLNGSAVMNGTDTANVTYQNAGTDSSN